METENQPQLHKKINYELNDNDINELSTLFNKETNELDNQEGNKEFESYLAENKNNKELSNESSKEDKTNLKS